MQLRIRLRHTLFVLLGTALSGLLPLQAGADDAKGAKHDGKLRIIAFGAHPDDCELNAAGVAAKWAQQGHHVKFVSTTNGDIGHWKMAGGPLAQRRTEEVQKAAKILGIETRVLDNHDGELQPTLENRKTITRLIREWRADVVLTHHAFDYHPDHRYTSQLVQDSSYMVTVPFFCPDTPHLEQNPVFLYYGYREHDHPLFTGQGIAVSIEDVFDKQTAALNAMPSQFDEGGANGSPQSLERIPDDPEKRREYYANRWKPRYGRLADRHRDLLIDWYGEERGKAIKYAQVFQVCKFGRRPTRDELASLFPFFPEQ